MKFKYKKMVIMITMCTMFIGFIIFSIISPNGDTPAGAEKKKETAEPKTTGEDKDSKKAGEDKDAEEAGGDEDSGEEPSSEPSRPPVSTEIVKDLNTDVSEVVKKYLEASIKCDMDALEEVVSNINLIEEEELKLKYKYVEGVENIECYMVSGPEENGYLVYVYRELKIKDIETLAPGLSRMYVSQGYDGKFRVFFGVDTGLEAFITETDQSEKVVELVEKVNKKLEEATSTDAALKEFNDKITASSQNSGDDKKDEKSSDKSDNKKDAGE